jgi:hypothetical protein
MKNLMFVIIAVLSVLTVSCKKNSETPAPVAKADYFQLKAGNYWIYQGYKIDTNGVATPTGKYDSAHIEKDTVIRGFTYYKLLENPFVFGSVQFPSYLRDSSGYLVNSTGYILASDFNFTDTLEVTNGEAQLYIAYTKMTGQDSVVAVPAGAFQSLTTRMKVVPLPPNTQNYPIRYSYDVYGKNVGKMKSHTFFWSGVMLLEARLVRYKVN